MADVTSLTNLVVETGESPSPPATRAGGVGGDKLVKEPTGA